MLKLSNITIQVADQFLLDDTSVLITNGMKVGIVGRNGCGKSTLFKIILGTLQSHNFFGKIEFSKNKRIASVEQEIQEKELDMSILQFVLSQDQILMSYRKKIEPALPEDISEIMEQLSFLENNSAEARVAEILDGLGFEQSDFIRSVRDFSGGWRMRLALAGALFQSSNYLLLDEPTNHLDVHSKAELWDSIDKFPGSVILVTHEDDFYDGLVDLKLEFGEK